MIWIHIDDGIVTSSHEKTIRRLEATWSSVIKIKWLAGLDLIVRLTINQDEKGFKVTQPGLINKILAEEWNDTAPFPTEPLPESNKGEGVDGTGYLHIIGCLNYLAVATRPDIAFLVNFLARFSKNPSSAHWRFLSHLINYLATQETNTLP